MSCRILAALVLLLVAASASAIDTDEKFSDPARQELYERVTHEARCLVCQNQTIADSTAPLAADLRREIHEMVAAGRSEDEIETFLVDRYGDFVLYRPRFKNNTALLWLAPGLLLSVAGAALWIIVRRRAGLPVPTDDDDAPPTPGAVPGDS